MQDASQYTARVKVGQGAAKAYVGCGWYVVIRNALTPRSHLRTLTAACSFRGRIVLVKTRTLTDEVFALLRSRGRLDVSQIAAEFVRPSDEIQSALDELEREGVVAERPDRGAPPDLPPELRVWGIHYHKRRG